MPTPTWIGHTLGGRYHIETLLGQGGMSAVYKAHDPNLRRVVAIKLIHSHLAIDPQFVRRFEEEAAAVAALRHPHIVQVFDFNHDEDVYYMVLEYIEGESLQSRLQTLHARGQRLPLNETLAIAATICEAVSYAHDRGLIHRDIKPANIMLTAGGQPVLMDFGVVKIIGGQQHTATGAVIGTPTYIAPELVLGQKPEARADIYSLGVMLYEMVAGQPPFDADSAMTLMLKHVNDPVPDIRLLKQDVPERVVAAIEKALSKKPADRFASALDFATALRGERPRATITQPAPARPTPPQSTPPRPASTPAARPNRGGLLAPIGCGLIALVGVLGVLAVVGLLSLNLLNFGGASPTPPSPTAVAVATLPQNTAAPTAETVAETQTVAPTLPTLTETATASATFTEPPPTATLPPPTETLPAGPLARIVSIVIEGDHYAAAFETVGYIAVLPGQHVHFYFNTVPPEQAGSPGGGPWFVHAATPNPFVGYKVSDRPAGATQMCVLVANPNHSIILNSGNCVDLP